MNEETFNLQLRKFLKKVGVGSQREIEAAVRAAIASGAIAGNERLSARVVLTIEELGKEVVIEDSIALE